MYEGNGHRPFFTTRGRISSGGGDPVKNLRHMTTFEHLEAQGLGLQDLRDDPARDTERSLCQVPLCPETCQRVT
jgi:hypothetical protein